MASIQCFLLEPTARERRSLRRYTYSTAGECPKGAGWGHDASVVIEDAPTDGLGTTTSGDLWPHDDDRWPTTCAACDYQFQDDDQWQLSNHRIYKRADTGEEMVLRDAPAGAMWYADWLKTSDDQVYEGPGKFIGPDGHCLCVQLPDGYEWVADGPATGGGGWTRTGTPPNVTANPSIGRLGKDGSYVYHGWLRDGALVDA